jgi:glycosyltransferase involved in cell wall biosynthesis
VRFGLVIPVYNAGNRLQPVLSQARQVVPIHRIFVVDDGSTDGTAESAAAQGVTVLRHSVNRGKGKALRTGFKRATAEGLEAVVTLDGDGQHDPERILRFVHMAESENRDLILGVRCFQPGIMPRDRIFSNRTSSMIVSLASGRSIPDSQCGYRLIRSWILKKVPLTTCHFETETELLIKALWMGARVGFCPIPLTYAGEGSYIRRLQDTGRFCRLILRLLWEHG